MITFPICFALILLKRLHNFISCLNSIVKFQFKLCMSKIRKKFFPACANWMFESHNDTRLRLSGKQPSQWIKKWSPQKTQFCKLRTMYLLFWMNKVYNFFHRTYCTTPFAASNQLIKSINTTLLRRIFLLILIYF